MPLTKTFFYVEKTTSFDLIISTAVEGCHYAWGAQRDSSAIPLRVPASRWSLADMINIRPRTFQPISRAVMRKM